MASVLAIVSKAQFEETVRRTSGASASIGSKLAIDRYASAHRSLEPLGSGGALFLVTVRPPDEGLWLVGIVERPTFADGGWKGAPSSIAIADVSALRSKLKFASGKGITPEAGKLSP